MGLHVQVALAGTLTVTGFLDPTGASVSKVFPAASVGQLIAPGNAKAFPTGCTMTLSVAADYNGGATAAGNVTVDYRAIT